ncbi:hypothetical protein ALT_6463 [Aspergillus lentulus]|uniref:Uncharacterized protein n=1 Tax=Aspergillus lentulus TaxID=293939 RepID=A0AAN4TCS2_ASPLE|nr:uncharacterized protein IFM58399_09164 [Aspergillus lentulus]GAQ09142.1 hypothetical protein ALT_6463 [Aspergillus lentulus]GFF51817.1 hypothetical protein IFM58399_09164 [Aspergillus lentulus]GFF76081.1 hypothetical protein IFM62136_09230 [Aspergillus lentulus]
MSATTVSTSDISLQPLTTPFIPPPGCGNQYSTTDYLLYSKHSYHLSVSKELPSCQPSGWGVSQSSRFDYSPAVCPAGWTAYSIGGTVSSASPMTAATRSVTTAFCCSKRFTLSTLYGLPIPGTSLPACFQSVSATTALLPRQTIPSPVPTVRMHEAWHITWASTDVPTLHPPPPDIGACTALALSSWVPGAAVEGGLVCESSSGEPPVPTNTNNSENYHDRESDTATRWFLIVGLPIIAVFAVAGCCICACCRQKKRRKKRLEPSNQQASLDSRGCRGSP